MYNTHLPMPMIVRLFHTPSFSLPMDVIMDSISVPWVVFVTITPPLNQLNFRNCPLTLQLTNTVLPIWTEVSGWIISTTGGHDKFDFSKIRIFPILGFQICFKCLYINFTKLIVLLFVAISFLTLFLWNLIF